VSGAAPTVAPARARQLRAPARSKRWVRGAVAERLPDVRSRGAAQLSV